MEKHTQPTIIAEWEREYHRARRRYWIILGLLLINAGFFFAAIIGLVQNNVGLKQLLSGAFPVGEGLTTVQLMQEWQVLFSSIVRVSISFSLFVVVMFFAALAVVLKREIRHTLSIIECLSKM